MAIVLLTGDLMVMSRVAGAAARIGVALHTASSAERAVDICGEQSARLLIIDLATASLDVAALVIALRHEIEPANTIIAFGPHVHEERLTAARDAGCDRVISRGQFFGQLDAILEP